LRSRVAELFTYSTEKKDVDWEQVVQRQHCEYAGKKCFKIRKSEPEISIGTCTMLNGLDRSPLMICPNRLLERRQIFMDSLHLLTGHTPGNELHLVTEVGLPGGSVDYVLVSVKAGDVRDFVGIELQTLDTTGTVWPERQKFLQAVGLDVEIPERKSFGMNWKMTAKTTLVQLHHKIETFEGVHKHLVLVVQDELYKYFVDQFDFSDVVEPPDTGHSMHFHRYSIEQKDDKNYTISLKGRSSTNAAGIARCIGQTVDPSVELEAFKAQLLEKITADTLITFV
jgi:hypothetical protein